MHLISRSNKAGLHPELLWRNQIQSRLNDTLSGFQHRIHDLPLAEWQSVKHQWKKLIQDAFVSPVPNWRGALKINKVAEYSFPDYTIENFALTAFDGWVIGLNLYRPARFTAPLTPILCPCGHGPKWFDDHQLPPQVLAKAGFAAALFDMPMFGERENRNDHFIQGTQAAMTGLWSNFFFLVDLIRVADYLETRPDMDFSRGIGVTGVSGGGLSTMFIPALDPRVRCIAPTCCVVSARDHLISGLYTGCVENYIRGQLAAGMDSHLVLAVHCPLPCLVNAGRQDTLFTEAAVKSAYQDLEKIYKRESRPERIRLFFDECPHKYTPRMAAQTVEWMRRWLRNDTTPFPVPATEILDEKILNCQTASLTLGMKDYIDRQCKELADRRVADSTSESIGLWLRPPAPQPVEVELIPPLTQWGAPNLHRFILHRPDDLPLPALVIRRETPVGKILVGCTDQGKLSLMAGATGFFGLSACHVVSADLRGFGELQPEPTDYEVYPWCRIDRVLVDLLGMNGELAVAQQVGDLQTILRALAQLVEGSGDITLYGQGEAALPVLLAGLLAPSIKNIVLHQFPAALELLATHSQPAWTHYQMPAAVLQQFDIPDWIRQRTDKRFLLINPCDARKKVLSESEASQILGTAPPHVQLAIHPLDESPGGLIAAWMDK
jgi:dienelactone hydrolase